MRPRFKGQMEIARNRAEFRRRIARGAWPERRRRIQLGLGSRTVDTQPGRERWGPIRIAGGAAICPDRKVDNLRTNEARAPPVDISVSRASFCAFRQKRAFRQDSLFPIRGSRLRSSAEQAPPRPPNWRGPFPDVRLHQQEEGRYMLRDFPRVSTASWVFHNSQP